MGFDDFVFALFALSLLTGLFTEAIKKMLEDVFHKEGVGTNVIACICSVVVSVLTVIGYVIFNEVAVTAQFVVIAIALTIMSWVCSMVGYDKVAQTLEQLRKKE